MHKIFLGGKHKDKFAIVDEEDFEWLSEYSWCFHPGGAYARIKGNNKNILMHRLITGVSNPSVKVDHENFNRLDNRKENLRSCTNQQNCANTRPKPKRSRFESSSYKGVFWSERGKRKWRAQIMVSGKSIHLGCYPTQKEAALSYNLAAVDSFGEFAFLNKV